MADDAQHRTLVLWDDTLLGYDFGDWHPMAPVRLALTMRLARDLGVLAAPGVLVEGVRPAADELLLRVHDREYVDAVRAGSPIESMGLGTDDVPVFAGMHDVSASIAWASHRAAQAVWSGEVQHAVNIAGGLHHARRACAAGFCVYNDPAVAIAGLLDAGAERVAYVDLDVHHGDGVEQAFWDDPRVLTISVHENGHDLFPGTGWPGDVGGPRADGDAVNVALPAGTGSGPWLRAVDAVVPALLRAFRPQVIVSQHGCDAHVLDPLAHLSLSVDALRLGVERMHALAHTLCDGRWIGLGGGGYEAVDVVPRAWTHLVAEAAHAPVPPETAVPAGWRDWVLATQGRVAPGRMTDGDDPRPVPWARGHDPADPVDRAVMATRRAVFPLHGLDPWFD